MSRLIALSRRPRSGLPFTLHLQRLFMSLRFAPALACLTLLLSLPVEPVKSDSSTRSAAEPSIVPLLVAGEDTRHLTAQALAAGVDSKALSAWRLSEQPGASQRIAEAAAELQRATRSPDSSKSLAQALAPAMDQLRAADLLLRAGYPMFSDQSLAAGLGLQSVLQQRAAESVSRWNEISSPLLSAAESLRSSPNAKAAQVQLGISLGKLLPTFKSQTLQVNAQLPVHRPGLAPAALSQGNAIAPSYADASDPLPLDEDLLPAGEVQFTEGVLRQAQSMGYRYVELFDFVRSNVRTEWSAGSTQSPDRTLRRLAGNDVEQASLLIALLRASGAPARYVLGVVEVPVADLAQQIGLPEDQLGRALTAAGIAHRPRVSGGRVVAYQIRHIWVSARVPYGNYRGTVADTTEPTWIPLMPALKPASFQAGAGVHSRIQHDMTSWLQSYLRSPQTVLPWPELRQRWAAQLAALQPPVELSSLRGQHEVEAAAIGLLPASTPYPVIAVHAEYGVLPEEERQWMRVRLHDPSQPQAPPLLEARVALGDLESHRFVLAFLPATVEDQHMTNANGSLGAFPLNLIRLRPSLMSEGIAARPGRGEVIGGTSLELEIELATPNGSLRSRNLVHAGSIAGFALDAHGDGTREPAPADGVGEIPLGGMVLNRFAERYLAEWAQAEAESAALMGVRVIRPAPALAVALLQVMPMGAMGLVERLEFQGVVLDAALRPLEPVSLDGQATIERDWLELTALHGSALESLTFEELWSVAAVSADRLLQRADVVLELAPGSSLDQIGAHSEPVRQQVAYWLAQGKHVQISQMPQSVEAWTGSAWRVRDIDSGESGYFLSGGYAGGATSVPPGLWYFQDLAEALADPYAEAPNTDPNAVALVQMSLGAQNQTARASQQFAEPLVALALDLQGRPVEGASLRYLVIDGGLRLQGGSGAAGTDVTVVTDRRGRAQTTATAPEQLASQWLVWVEDDAGRETYARAGRVDVSATSGSGVIAAGDSYHLYMLPGELSRVELVRGAGPTRTFGIDGTYFHVSSDGWSNVYPMIDHVHALLRGFDEYGNRTGGFELNVAVRDQFHSGCVEDADEVIPSLLYGSESGCPASPELGGHECLAPTLSVVLSRFGEASASVVPTNIVETRSQLVVSWSDLEWIHEFGVGMAEESQPPPVCISFARGYLLVENVPPDALRAARIGEQFPVPRQFVSYRMWSSGDAHFSRTSDIFDTPDTAEIFKVRGGTRSPVRTVGTGLFEFDVSAGDQPSQVDVYIELAQGGTRWEVPFAPAWALRLDPPQLNPHPLLANEFQRLEMDHVLEAPIQPESYRVPRLELGGYSPAGDMLFGGANLEGSQRKTQLLRGLDANFPEHSFLRYTVNPGSENPLHSESVPFAVVSGIVAGYGSLEPSAPLPSLNTLLGDRFPRLLHIQTEIDTQTDYVCQTGNRFMFALGQPAQVDLEFFALDEDGARGSSALLALDDVAYEAGVFEEDLPLGRLPIGAYEFELRARTDSEDEVHVGRLVHREKLRGSLPLGRSLVKGVDVHDGHAVISAEDVSVAGRGPGLRFTRTYSSHSGDDETVLGRGWHSDIESKIVPDSCGSYVVMGAAGQGQRYVPDGSNADGSPRFRSGNGFHGTLRRVTGSSTDFDFFSKDGTRYHFAERDVGGVRLSYIEDPSGNRVTYEYSRTPAGLQVTRAEDSAGRSLTFSYATQRLERTVLGVPAVQHRTLLASVTGPGGQRVAYSYSGDGNLQRAVRSGGGDARREDSYQYRDFGGLWLRQGSESRYYHMGFRLTEARDSVLDSARQYTWQVGWTGLQVPDGSVYPIPEMRVETLAETDSGTVSFSYGGLRPLEPTVTTVTDARGGPSTYTMNRYGGTERLVAPSGTTLTDWDFEHLQPRAITDPLGTRTAWTFDLHGNRLSETVTHSAGSLSRSWSYVAPTAFAVPIKDRVRTATDARGTPTTYAYDARGRRTGQSRGGVTEMYGYSGNGDLISYTDGAGALVTYGYDAHGLRTSEADDLGQRMSASYDARGRKLSERNGEGEETSYTYDALDRVRSITHAAGVRYIDYQGRIRTERDERGNTTVFEHDAQGRQLLQRHAAGGERVMTYDVNGNLLSESDFRGNVTRHTYNAANHRTRSEAPLQRVTIYTHNARGQILTQRTEGGASEPRESRFEYAHPLDLPTLERHRIGDVGWAETANVYDGNGNLLQRTDAEGRVTVQVFDPRDRLIRIEAPDDRVETFAYDGADRRTASTLNTDPPQQRSWVFDVRGQQTRYTDASGGRWEQAFDRAGRLIASSDPSGATVTHAYDGAGRKTRESGPRPGQFVDYTLDAAGNRVGISDAAGRVIDNTFDALNRLETSTDGIGLIERLSYDTDSRVLSRENGRGEVTSFEYNALGHEILRTLPPNQAGARELAFEPGIHGEVLAETDANGHTTTHRYDGLGRRVGSTLSAVSGGGSDRSWSYDRVGNVLSHTDAANRTTTWRYSPRNQRIEQTDPSPPGTTQLWGHDVADNVVRHVDRRGIVHSQRHDGENRVIERRRDGLRIEALVYDGPGRVQKRTDARDEDTTYTYDPAGSVLTETRALGFVQRWTYWPWGSVKTHTDADGLVRTFEYDARQRLTKDTDPAGAITTHDYDLADHRTQTTRPGAAEWDYGFDADGKLIEVRSPEGHRTEYTHDAHGNRTAQRNAAGIVTRFTYDARHRVIAIDHLIGGDEGFAYNGEGELIAHTDRAGQRIEIGRDGLGRITERRYGAAQSGEVSREAFTLDGDGQPTTLSQYGDADGPHHVQRRYDGQGRLIEEDDRFNQRSAWTYDEVGNRLSVTDPAGTTRTAPDRLNRIARQTTAAGSTELSYSTAGRLQQITHPNGARSETRYDAAGRIERITHHQGSSEVARFEYTYDARGNRREERRIDASGTQRTTYDYDKDDRLTGTTVTAPDSSVTETTYTLDPVGNRRQEVVRRNGATVSDIAYTYQAYQRLTQTRDSVSGVLTEYAYDARGHLVSETRSGQTTTYRPNAQDRLATLTLPGAPPVQIDYAYDSEGKRVERRTPTELTRFGWDGQTLRRETNAANNVIEAHDWAAGRILSSRRLADTRYAQHDALRSPIRWSQSTGAEQGQLRYDAWGETTDTHPDLPRIAYTGHYREREGTSYYAQQRYYRPGLGRFNRVDPWEGDPLRPITLNKYLYANGNPLAFIDPDGRASRWVSEDEIPHGASYWAINRGGRVQYWNTSADAYSDASNYQIARGMASAFGATAQTMERGALDRLSRWATGADAEPASASAAAEPLQVVESGGPQGVGLTDPNWEMARLAQLRSGLTTGVEGVKQGAEIASEVICGLHVACSGQEAVTGIDQSGRQLSGLERGLAGAPTGLSLLRIGGTGARSASRSADRMEQAGGGLPDWLKKLFRDGEDFNQRQRSRYPYNEVYVERSCGQGACLRLDSYNPRGGPDGAGEIVSRKFTQLSDVQPETAVEYLRELQRKYAPGTVIADTPKNREWGLAGERLRGQMYLDVPVQNAPVPRQILDEARRRDIRIRDEMGNEL